MVTSAFHLWQFQVFNSSTEGMMGVFFGLGMWEISFCLHHDSSGDLRISSPALYHCAKVTSGFHLEPFQAFYSGLERLVVVLFWMDLWGIFFWPVLWFNLGNSGYLVLHSTSVPRWLLVFTSDNFRYSTLVQRHWWWHCSVLTCERYSFCLYQDLNLELLDL